MVTLLADKAEAQPYRWLNRWHAVKFLIKQMSHFARSGKNYHENHWRDAGKNFSQKETFNWQILNLKRLNYLGTRVTRLGEFSPNR
jgi:hypothetical protein